MCAANASEGVIQFALDYQPAPPLPHSAIHSLTAWRTILHDLQLIGQDPLRYDGYGFGNISVRVAENPSAFVITGSQTGQPRALGPAGYCTVTVADPARNHITAHGPCKPSSESLTHAAIYQALPGVAAVVHCHCPSIWQAAEHLSLQTTAADISYGTPAMAAALQYCARQAHAPPAAAMLGHVDGILTWGPTLQQASQRCISLLADSLTLFSPPAA